MIKRPLVLWLAMSIATVGCIFVANKTGGIILGVIYFFLIIAANIISGNTYNFKGRRYTFKVTGYDNIFLIIGMILMLYFGIISYESIYNKSKINNDNEKTKITGTITSKKQKNEYMELVIRTSEKEKVLVYVSKTEDENTRQFLLGDKINVIGTKKYFDKSTNLGEFNQHNYYCLGKDYAYKINALAVDVSKKEKEFLSYYSMAEFFDKIRNKLMQQSDKVFDERDSGVIKAMVLGDNSDTNEELTKLYSDNGIIHLMVISGTHISLLAMAVYEVLKKKLKVWQASMLGIFVAGFYVMLTGFTPSSNRALIMMFLMLGYKVVLRTYDMKSAIGLSGLIIMLINPLSVILVGFILSFLAVVAIAYPYEKCREIVVMDNKRQRKMGETSFYSKIENVWEGIKNSIILSGLINLFTLPIILFTYFEYPVYSIFVNVITAPFVPYIIILSILALGSSLINVSLGRFLAGGVHYILSMYEKVCKVTGDLPCSKIRTGQPMPWQIILYYVILVVMFLALTRLIKKINLIYKRSTVIMLYIMILLIAGNLFLTRRETREDFVQMLDVGQGDCFFINNSKGVHCLIDGGSSSNLNVGERIISNYLKAINIRELDYVFISHFDTDHINGIIQLAESEDIRINNIIIPCLDEERKKEYKNTIDVLKKCGANIYEIKEGMVLKEKDFRLICLNPTEGISYKGDNSLSTCLYMENGKSTYLFTGDVCDEGEEVLLASLEKYAIESVDYLKVAHHGSNTSTTIELLDRIKPKVALISCGKDNSYGHPHKEVIDMLNKAKCKIVITAENGGYKCLEI